MARTRTDWNNLIDTAALANGISLSTSGSAEWKLWRDLIVTIAMLLEGIWLLFAKETDNYISSKQHGSLYWYAKTAKEFQYGDSLTIVDGIPSYVPVVPANRIVGIACVREVDEELTVLKVAANSGGSYVALTAPQLTAFKSYFVKRGIPGSKLNIFTANGDTLYLDGVFYYDPLVDPSNIETNMFAQLEVLKANFNSTSDDILYRSSIVNAILNVPGIVAIGTLDLQLNGDSFDVSVELPAGYFNVDPSSVFVIEPAP